MGIGGLSILGYILWTYYVAAAPHDVAYFLNMRRMIYRADVGGWAL